jgi:hypothetical protein
MTWHLMTPGLLRSATLPVGVYDDWGQPANLDAWERDYLCSGRVTEEFSAWRTQRQYEFVCQCSSLAAHGYCL